MAWQLMAQPDERPEWVQWVDGPAVARALRTLAYQVAHPIDESDIDGNDQNFGWQKTVDLFRTLQAFAEACDLPPTVLGYYASLRLALDAGNDIPGLYLNPGTLRPEVVRIVERHSEVVRDALAARGPETPGGWREGTAFVDLVIQLRVDFDATELVAVRRGDPPDTAAGRDRTLDDRSDHLGSSIPWLTTTWSEYRQAGASNQVYVFCYPPLKVSYELGLRVARLILERGAKAAVTRSVAFVVVRNMRVARLLAGPGAPDEDVLRAAAEVDVLAISAPDYPPVIDAALDALKAAGRIAAEVPGGELAQLVVTIVTGVVLWPYLIWGAAVGRDRDVWGRAEPRLYGRDLRGSLLPRPGGTAPPYPPTPPPFDVVEDASPATVRAADLQEMPLFQEFNSPLADGAPSEGLGVGGMLVGAGVLLGIAEAMTGGR